MLLTLLRWLVFSLGCLSSLASQAGWLDTPDSLKLQAVGEELRLDGTPMQIKAFNADLSVEAALQQVQESWQKHAGRSPVKRSQNEGWFILNQSIGRQHRSFQVRETGSNQVQGYIALTSPERASKPKPMVPLPSDMKTLSIIDSVDAGKVSQQILAASPRSMAATVSALESALKTAGWERHVLKKNGAYTVFSANRKGQEFDARLTAQKNGTLLMMNTVLQSE